MKQRSLTPPARRSTNIARKSREKLALGLAAAATLSIGAISANAATVTWDGGATGAGTAWISGSNWVGDVVPTSTDSVVFDAALTRTISLGASQTVSDLTFGGASAAFTIGAAADISSGYNLTLTNVRRSASPTVAQTIAADVVLANNSTWNIGAGTGTFKVSGGISGAGMSLTKTGAGSMTLTGSNTYTGATIVNQGTLILDFANQATPTDLISSSSPLTLAGGTLQIKQKSGVVTSQTFANTAVNAGASAIIGTNIGTASALNIALGTITRTAKSGTLAIGSGGGGGTLNFNTLPTTGSISVSNSNDASGILGTWATVGSGATLQYATVSSGTIAAYTGATTADATLSNVSSATGNYNFSTNSTLAGNITGNTLRYSGAAGTMGMLGNSGTLNGIMNAGTGDLTISGTGIGVASGTGTLYIGSNRELVIQSNSKNITISSVIANNAAGKSGLTFAGSGTLALKAVNTYTGDTTVLAGTILPDSAARIQGDLIVGSSGGGPAAFYGSAATQPYTKFNTGYSSNVTVYNNGFAFLAGNGDSHVKNLTIVGGTTQLGGSFYLDGTLTMTGGALTGYGIAGSVTNIVTNASASTATISTGYLTAALRSFNVADGAAAIDLLVSGTKSGSYTLVKDGQGVMALSAANSFNGSTTVNAGTLVLSNSFALQNSALATGGTGIVFDSSVASHAFKIGGLDGSGNLALQDNASTPNAVALTLSNTTSTVRTYSGNLSGAGSIIKTGSGAQVFTTAQSYTGNTTITGGTLTLQGAGSINNSPIIDVQTGAVLNLAALSSFAVGSSQTLQGTGTVTGPTAGELLVSGTLAPAGSAIGTLAVSGSLTLAGTTVVDINKTGIVLTSDLVNNATTLTLGGTLTVNLTGDALAAGDSFTLFGGSQLAGSFSSYNLPTLDTGLTWDTTQLSIDGQLLVVPEPSTWALMVGGLGMMAFGTRLRRRMS